MTIFVSTDLLADFKYQRGRPSTDEESTDAQLYRLLTLAQRQVQAEFMPLFPRLFIAAPALMVTTDGGLTYHMSGTDADTRTIVPLGHAEVYASGVNGRELYASNYGGPVGDVVFEGNQIRMPRGGIRTFDSGPYIRATTMASTLSAADQPTLPTPLLDLIVPKALVLWARRGALRDERSYEAQYAEQRNAMVQVLTTQYRGASNAALDGITWFRFWLANGGAASLPQGPSF